MALGGAVDAFRGKASDAAREIVLWTTRDGREIPLDEMSDDHIANAIRVLSLWKQRLKKRASDDPVIDELKRAIDRFKEIERRRRKAASRLAPKPSRLGKPQSATARSAKDERPKVKSAYSAFGSRAPRPRKPDANT
jgi:hypothetical protein